MTDISSNINQSKESGEGLVRISWHNIATKWSKTLYGRFLFLNQAFYDIMECLANGSGIDNTKGARSKRFFWVIEKYSSILGQELSTEIIEARKVINRFYYLQVDAKKNNDTVTETELTIKGFTEDIYIKTLSTFSQFWATVYDLEIPKDILEIISTATDDEQTENDSILEEEIEKAGENDLVSNKSYRFPFIIIIDNSISMQEYKRFESLLQGLKDLFDKINSNIVLSSRVELYVATCEREPREIVKFAMIDRQIITLNQLNLKPNGPCKMASTIEMALNRLKERLDLLSEPSYDIKYFRPWMLILSDGKFREDMSKVINRIRKDFGELQVYVRGLSNRANMTNLRLLDPEATILDSLAGFFKDVFVSLKRIQTSIPGGERISLLNQQGFTQNP